MPRDADPPRMASARGASLRPLRDTRDRSGRVVGLLKDREADLGACLCHVLSAGCALLVGATADLGALSVTLYDGDQRWREYASTPEELAEVLLAIQDHIDARMVGASPHGATKRD